MNNKSQANIYSTISSINIGDNVNVNDDIVDDINIMVNHLPNSDMILTDFQRIGTNRNDTDVYRKRFVCFFSVYQTLNNLFCPS